MAIALGAIAVLLVVAVIFLKKFMDDMAQVESELIRELREIRGVLTQIRDTKKL